MTVTYTPWNPPVPIMVPVDAVILVTAIVFMAKVTSLVTSKPSNHPEFRYNLQSLKNQTTAKRCCFLPCKNEIIVFENCCILLVEENILPFVE